MREQMRPAMLLLLLLLLMVAAGDATERHAAHAEAHHVSGDGTLYAAGRYKEGSVFTPSEAPAGCA